MARTAKQQHLDAMLSPQSKEEVTIVALFKQLDALGERYRGDSVALPVIEHLGSAIIGLFDQDLGRLDQQELDDKVRAIVQEAGGNAGNL